MSKLSHTSCNNTSAHRDFTKHFPKQFVLQALNQEKARAYFSCRDDTSMWDMIDMSALQLDPSDTHSEISTHLDIQDRFWEHHPSSSVNHWDDFSRVRQPPCSIALSAFV